MYKDQGITDYRLQGMSAGDERQVADLVLAYS